MGHVTHEPIVGCPREGCHTDFCSISTVTIASKVAQTRVPLEAGLDVKPSLDDEQISVISVCSGMAVSETVTEAALRKIGIFDEVVSKVGIYTTNRVKVEG